MQEPDIPFNEKQRLEALRTLKILDTAPEERFDRLTRMAKRMFGVPISLVSLVDFNRQWFKSKQGIDVEETPRNISFCGHAILQDDVFIVPNALEDERFADNPLVMHDPNIRFYAGCPLKVSNGGRLGTLCLIDSKPRTMDDEDIQLLKDLAAMAEQEIAAVQMATQDELTLISNRRGFYTLGEHAISVCRRQARPLTLLLFDLNEFKPINDNFGHAEGDRALVAFAELIRRVFRESDIFARLGGDEFAVMLADITDSQVQQVVERFAQAVEEYNQAAQRGYRLAYSVGSVAFDPQRHNGIEDLLAAADRLMYQHKKSR